MGGNGDGGGAAGGGRLAGEAMNRYSDAAPTLPIGSHPVAVRTVGPATTHAPDSTCAGEQPQQERQPKLLPEPPPHTVMAR